MKPIFLAAVVALILTGCTRTATITVDPGMNGPQPDVECHVVVPNANHQPTTESKKP